MFERIKLNPLVNQRVIFKLRTEASTMDAVILGYDNEGYWIKGGTLAEYLKRDVASDQESDVRYLEIRKIQWLHKWPGKIAYRGAPVTPSTVKRSVK